MSAARKALAAFADELGRLRRAAGSPSLHQLVALTASVARPLARSTISDTLNARSLPDWDFVSAFVAACAAHAAVSGRRLPAGAVDVAVWDARHLRMLADVDAARTDERLVAAATAELARRSMHEPDLINVARQPADDHGGFVDRRAELETRPRVGVLGPVCVWHGLRALPAGPPQRQLVLAVLAAHRDRAVSIDRLVEVIWIDAPPASAANRVHVHVSALRALLEPQRSRRASATVLCRHAAAYRLNLEPDEVDLDLAVRLLAQASSARAAGDVTSAVEATTQALALWRGEGLSGLTGVWADAERARMEDLRLGAIEDRAADLIHLGRPTEVAVELAPLLAEHRYRERLLALLMLALDRAGRQADALKVYSDTRRDLAEALGLEPGAELQRLHRDILRGEPGDPELYVRAPERVVPATAAVTPPVPTPRELPADVASFTGRERDLATLDGLLPAASGPSSTVVISAVSGAGGVGKTALAVHWAHRVAGRFPDGQLYINLGGYDRAEPVEPAAALGRILRSLGVDGSAMPQDEAELAVRYRTLMAGRRMIVVLDNARTAEQVRPLLPGTADHFVLVTSRDNLAGLVAREGAHRIDLDIMAEGEAISLLGTLIGARVDDEPEAARELAIQCGHLPLALRVAAGLALTRADLLLADIVEDLREDRRRLDLLDAGGDPGGIRAVFGWSVRHLSAPAATAFALLGVHPGPDFDRHALAALTATDIDDARRIADELARAHLISTRGPWRYAMHDLMRAYAAERAAAQLPRAEAHQALIRLFDYYLDAAATAVSAIYPYLRDPHQRHAEPPWSLPSLHKAEDARRWLDAERANFVAMAGLDGLDERQRIDLSLILHRYLLDQGHHRDALVIHGAAASRASEPNGHVTTNVGSTLLRLGRLDEAAEYLGAALEQHRRAGDEFGEGRVHTNLAIVEANRWRHRQALAHSAEALAVYRRVGDQTHEAWALMNLGCSNLLVGNFAEAAERLHEALALSQRLNDRYTEGYVLGYLGVAYGHMQRETEAINLIHRCLEVCREFSDSGRQAEALVDLARIHRSQGRLDDAMRKLETARSIATRIAEPAVQMSSLNGLGDTLRAMGRPAQACGYHREAFTMACRVGDPYHRARALDGIADVIEAQGSPSRARRLWRRVLASYVDLGVPEAADVRRRLVEPRSQDRPGPRAEA
jgi:DNA-binding SARP family transcriptional activator